MLDFPHSRDFVCVSCTVRIQKVIYECFSIHPTGKPTGYGPSSRRSHNRGIVDECCFQSCELRRLEMYCAPVKPGKTPRSLRAQRHTDSPRTPKVSSHADDVRSNPSLSSALTPYSFDAQYCNTTFTIFMIKILH